MWIKHIILHYDYHEYLIRVRGNVVVFVVFASPHHGRLRLANSHTVHAHGLTLQALLRLGLSYDRWWN
jgi:hypothetical protein